MSKEEKDPPYIEVNRVFSNSRLSKQVIASAYENLLPSKRILLNSSKLGHFSEYQDSLVHHIVNGDTVLTYTSPVVGGSLDGLDTTRFRNGQMLTSGFIAIQAESHGIMFRSISVKDLLNESFSASSR